MTSTGLHPSLEHRISPGEPALHIPVTPLPFRIGRGSSADLVLHSPLVSKAHCEILERSGAFWVRDLESRNGTYVNGERVEGERALEEGDIVIVAGRELRFGYVDAYARFEESTQVGHKAPPDSAAYQATKDLQRILAGPAVSAVFQPIVELATGRVIGYEALGRQTLPSLSFGVADLFRVAHERGQAEELAALMRTAALQDAPGLPAGGQRVFMNVHPSEMQDGVFLRELERSVDALADGRRLVAEIHESAVTEPEAMVELKKQLASLGIELAYDDFGAGQARLMELAEAPPDFLKLDISLIKNIDRSVRRQELVAALVGVMREAGIRVVAEGIETPEEARACRDLGCELAQGFFFRHPLPVDALR